MRKKREESFITITEVAKEANVSIATVSRVMNNGKVSAKRKVAVLDAIKRLNYVPNNSARNLASTNTTKRIRLLVPNIGVPCYTDLIKGFKKGVELYKYDSEIIDYDNELDAYDKYNMDSFSTSEIKGVVQIGPYHEIPNKIVVSLDDELLKLVPSENYNDKKIGIYFPNDKFLKDHFDKNVFTKNKIVDLEKGFDDSMDMYITQTVEGAAKIVNEGISKPIYVLDQIKEVEILVPNIHPMPIDFYTIGLILSRISIKKIMGTVKDDDESLVIEVN